MVRNTIVKTAKSFQVGHNADMNWKITCQKIRENKHFGIATVGPRCWSYQFMGLSKSVEVGLCNKHFQKNYTHKTGCDTDVVFIH